MDKIRKKWLPKPKADCGSNGEFVSMGIENMVSAFAMIIFAIGIAFFVLIIELVSKPRKIIDEDKGSKGKIENKVLYYNDYNGSDFKLYR